MQDINSARNFIEGQIPRALKILETMVGINSYTENKKGINQLARFTAECFEPLDFTAEFVPSTSGRFADHLILTRPGVSNQNILMISHLDTVFPPDEEARNNFHWLRDGDRIFGPGTVDIKGGTVMMWLVLAALQQCAPGIFRHITWKLFWNS